METTVQELRCSELLKHEISATDGEIGSLSDILFDDMTWSIRYFVVKTGGWLSGRKVLVMPQSVDRAESPAQTIPVQLTKEQIRNSPDVNTDRPVSKQHDFELSTYYGIPLIPPPALGLTPVPGADGTLSGVPLPGTPTDEAVGNDDPHLRSAKELQGYKVRTSDGEAGKVEDVTIDWKVLRLTSMLIKTDDGRVVVVPGDSVVRRLSWENQEVLVHWSTDDVLRAPVSLL